MARRDPAPDMQRLAEEFVDLMHGTWTSPPAKAQKRFVNGEEDDLVFYYEALRTQA